MNEPEANILLNERDEKRLQSENKEKTSKFSSKTQKWIYQLAAVFSVSLVTMGFSIVEHWTSPALPHLRRTESGFSITPDQSSLILSLLNIGTILGCLIFPHLVSKLGLKKCLLLFTIPQMISFVMICLARNVATLYIARFMSGVGYGAGYVAQIIYVSEISYKNIRGSLIFITRSFYSMGTFFLMILGSFSSYETMNLALLTIPILFLGTFMFMPESPYFFLKHNREEEAFKSLSRLRGIKNPEKLSSEIRRMKEAVEINSINQKNGLRRLFEDKNQRRALMIMIIVQLSLIFSGARLIPSIAQDFFRMTDSFLPPQHVYLIIIAVSFILSLPAARIVDRLGRRWTLLLSCLICSLCTSSVGMILFFKYYLRHDIASYSWIPFVAMVIFEVSVISGFLTTAIVLIGEIFSPQIKNTASCILVITKEICVFLTKISHQKLVATIDIYGVLWMYSSISFSLALVAFFLLPETKCKTLEEIQILLVKRKKRKLNCVTYKNVEMK